jgi:hypothetical protein
VVQFSMATRYQVRLSTWMQAFAFGTPPINGRPLFASVVADLRFARKCSHAEREFRDTWERLRRDPYEVHIEPFGQQRGVPNWPGG